MADYDLIVIGAGSAARSGAEKAAKEHGARVAIIERERWGGSCPNVACRPTKAYLVAAELAHDINTLADTLGIEVGPARANLARIKARKDSIRATQEQWRERLSGAGYELVDGVASFEDAHTVRVGDRRLSAERILIATGSRTAVPPVEGIDEIDWLDHVSALELTELPESLLVVGGGAVGLEFGQAFARFGSKVTIVDAVDRIAFRDDREAAAEVAAALEDEGIETVLNTFVGSVRQDGDEIVAVLAPRDGGAQRELRASRVLLAAGRVPNIEELELEKSGVAYTKAGITVDGHLRTSAEGIWAAGDVTGLAQFTPIAQYQARLAVEDMYTERAPEADYSILPTAIFTDPELAGVGMSEDEAREAGLDFDVVTHPVTAVTRAQYTDSRHGIYKLVFEPASRRVLGIHVVNRNASDIVQALALALKLGVTIDELAEVHHTYPSLGEGIKAAAEKARVAVAA
ncbi:MAG TPA: NAD(P)/FAD-dependent oxidoreductase [Gaiellaceae bacterium]|nr:NAD(P)/FAD-dependent oxidoreductase [Gaiellaceae bacterium]